jgi:ADP-heptose:LPS heptosyltransferase
LRRFLIGVFFPRGKQIDGAGGLERVKKILILRHDGIGDMVLTLPFLRMLKTIYPDALVSVMAGRGNRQLVERDHHVYQVLQAPGPGIRKVIRSIARLRSEKFDLVVDAFLTDSLSTALLARVVGGRYRCGFAVSGRGKLFNVVCPDGDLGKDMLENMKELAGCLGYTGSGNTSNIEGCITVGRQEKRWAMSVLEESGIRSDEQVLGIHPGGRFESQRWPIDRFYRVALEVRKRGKAKVLLFQQNEWEAGMDLERILPEGVVVIENTDLQRFAALTGRVTLFLCNNSGPLHIARAVGVQTVSFAGPTRRAFLPEANGYHRICETPLNCRPCDKPLCHHHTCLLSNDVENVTALVLERLTELKKKEDSHVSRSLNVPGE